MTTENVFSWVVSIVNFAILYVLFNAIVIKPMIQAAKDREHNAQKRIDEAESLYQDAVKHEAQFEKLLEGLPAEKEQIARHAQEEARRIHEYYLEEAEREGRFVAEKAVSEAALLARNVEAELTELAAEKSIERARRLLQEHLNSDNKKSVLDHFLERVGTANAS